jgi:hypothetical protein
MKYDPIISETCEESAYTNVNFKMSNIEPGKIVTIYCNAMIPALDTASNLRLDVQLYYMITRSENVPVGLISQWIQSIHITSEERLKSVLTRRSHAPIVCEYIYFGFH